MTATAAAAPRIVVDVSFGHAEATPANLDKVGADGAILYAGCNNPGKNCTKAELHTLLDAGKMVALVIENGARDLDSGQKVGVGQGEAIVAAAKALGYDYEHCVLFTAADFNAGPPDYQPLINAMGGYAFSVPVPGYYGDSDSIDKLWALHKAWLYWQSGSASFSPLDPTPNAHLWQQVGGAHGLPFDLNIVRRTPLRFMGEDMALTDAEVDKVAARAAAKVWGFDLKDPASGELKDAAVYQAWTSKHVDDTVAAVAELAKQFAVFAGQLQTIATAVAKLAPGGPVDVAGIAEKLQITAKP